MTRLIDADALENVFEEHEDRRGDLDCDWRILINNAPAVVKDYDTGYQDGLEDGLNDIRTQGEWINLIDIKNLYKCSICGRTIGLTHNETLSDYPFCHCGADMRSNNEG